MKNAGLGLLAKSPAGIAGAFGAKGLLSSDPTPQMGMAPESAQYKDMLGQIEGQAQLSEQDLVNRQLNQSDTDSQNLLGRQMSELGGDPALRQALSNRNKRNFDTSFADLKRQLNIDAPTYRMQRLKAVTGALSKEGALQRLAANSAYQNAAEEYKTRQQVISNVLGIGGTAAGALAGGAAGGGASGAFQGAGIGAQAGGGKFY